ncbi:Uncharacterized protein APZ42_002284 [Daphnia magna]|uniref:Uncharacterized protein n=1 Tax=Daphnia magna TaxID=35525 RepID=A0A164IDH8_9CRUS|nr:Uncharacterized protein APZ42_002284 [Daphnia magna]
MHFEKWQRSIRHRSIHLLFLELPFSDKKKYPDQFRFFSWGGVLAILNLMVQSVFFLRRTVQEEIRVPDYSLGGGRHIELNKSR